MIKLVRFERPDGEIRPGLIDDSGGVRDLSWVMEDIGPEHMAPDDLDILSSIEPETLPPADAARLLAPYDGYARIFRDDEGPTTEPVPADSFASITRDYRIGLAAVVGALDERRGPWAGAFMLAMTEPKSGWIALGPVLAAPGGRFKPQKLAGVVRADAQSKPFALPRNRLETRLKASRDAAVGDIVLATVALRALARQELSLAVDGFGAQRHPLRPAD